MKNGKIVKKTRALLDAYTDRCQQIADEAWAHIPEDGDMEANFESLFAGLNKDFEGFKAALLAVCSSEMARKMIEAYEWEAERG